MIEKYRRKQFCIGHHASTIVSHINDQAFTSIKIRQQGRNGCIAKWIRKTFVIDISNGSMLNLFIFQSARNTIMPAQIAFRLDQFWNEIGRIIQKPVPVTTSVEGRRQIDMT